MTTPRAHDGGFVCLIAYTTIVAARKCAVQAFHICIYIHILSSFSPQNGIYAEFLKVGGDDGHYFVRFIRIQRQWHIYGR